MKILKLENCEDWLKARKRGIGGSDAGSILGMNKYCSNIDKYREKTGIVEPKDISDNPAVIFGKKAEKHIRSLFALEHPWFIVDYHEFWMYVHEEHDFLYATLDGELTDKADGRRGILEIKTTEIKNNSQWSEWDGRIPDSYYVQVIHQLSCTGWDFVILRAYIRYERTDVLEDIKFVTAKEIEFWDFVASRTEPPKILPKI